MYRVSVVVEALQLALLVTSALVLAGTDLVTVTAVDEVEEEFLKSAKYPCWIPKVDIASEQGCDAVRQNQSPPLSPGAGMSSGAV